MRRNVLIGGTAAIVAAIVIAISSSPATAQYGYGPGMMGHGMMGYGMGPGMMGQGMMGYGMGPGMMGQGMMGYGMGPGMMGPAVNLTTNDVKANFERWITSTGNPNLKVGNVVEKDANTITADIVTKKENALVQQFTVDRRTGVYRAAQ